MRVTVTTATGELVPLEVAEDMELENLLALCQVEIPSLVVAAADCLTVMFNGQPLVELKRTLKDYGVKDGDVLLVAEKRGSAPPSSSRVAQASGKPKIDFSSIRLPGSAGGGNGDAAASSSAAAVDERIRAEVPRILESFRTDAYMRSSLRENDPKMAAALEASNTQEVARILGERHSARIDEERKRVNAMFADPFDATAQQYIEQQIQRENIESTLETAIEHMPENFGTVTMLYIACKVNGVPLKVFVDSGAQSTIISAECARRCNILRLVDKRFHGVARGVGTQKIVGRIHVAQMQLGADFLPVSFIVLEEQPMDVLLGLDMLKRHQCVIDLAANVLRIGTTGASAAFLPEADLPSYARLNSVGADDADDAMEPSSASAATVDEAAVGKLLEMGFDRARALTALGENGGSVERAAVSLLAKSLPKPPAS